MDFFIKRNDTLPVIEYTCYLDEKNRIKQSLVDTTIKFLMGMNFYLPSDIVSTTQTVFPWPDQIVFLMPNDKIIIDRERMLVVAVDPVTFQVTVERGVDGTTAAKHIHDTVVQLLRIEGTAGLKTDGTDGVCKYEWSGVQNDTKMSGRFLAEFEVVFMTTGKRQTFPGPNQQKIRVSVIEDLNAR
jgi:hypothetical protein